MNTNVTRIDLGCGQRKQSGCFGIDKTAYDGVDLALDLRFAKLPFKDEQLEYVWTSHFLEHLSFEEVLFLFNEIYRVMAVGGTLEIVVPHGFSYSGMADLSHKTFWTEDTFGYFSPDNHAYYEWEFLNPVNNQKEHVINKWLVEKNDNTPPLEYSTKGWIQLKDREIHAILKKIE